MTFGISLATSAPAAALDGTDALAGQAKAAQLAAGGRFALGIGLGHKAQVEGVFGVPFDRPIGHLRDYLRIVRSLLDTGTAEVHGATVTADLSSVPPSALRGGVTPRVPLLVAAMGPQALRAARRRGSPLECRPR